METVDSWINEAKRCGIISIICLLADDQLDMNDALPGGLVSYYKETGFEIAHVPARDHQWPPLTPEQLDRIWDAYQELPKPVLVHCSAGMDRTGQATKHIQRQLTSTLDAQGSDRPKD